MKADEGVFRSTGENQIVKHTPSAACRQPAKKAKARPKPGAGFTLEKKQQAATVTVSSRQCQQCRKDTCLLIFIEQVQCREFAPIHGAEHLE